MGRLAMRGFVLRCFPPLLLICLVLQIWIPQSFFLAPTVLPFAFSQGPAAEISCHSRTAAPISLSADKLCTGVCHPACFPRARVCVHSSKVVVCGPGAGPLYDATYRTHGGDSGVAMPSFMRFRGEKLTIPVEDGVCPEGNWIHGLSMVADQRFLPLRKPNPHHEAEKLIPALLLSRNFETGGLFWFTSQKDTSRWAKGFLSATGLEDMVRYLELPEEREPPVCFEDAVLFSAPTNVRYVSNSETNKWLRAQVLEFCSIPDRNVTWPLRKAVIVDRRGARHLANRDQVAKVTTEVLHIPVELREGGLGSFCDQVRAVAEEDFLIVPHGSQNVNLIFARPGAVIIEVFPHLFHTTALRNYTHAAGLNLYSLLGTRPPRNLLSWLFSFLDWDTCFYRLRLCKNYARKQPIHADLAELKKLLWMIWDA